MLQTIPPDKFTESIYELRSSCYAALNKDDAAAADLVAAAKLQPNHRCRLLCGAAELYYRKGRYKEALAFLDQVFVKDVVLAAGNSKDETGSFIVMRGLSQSRPTGTTKNI